MKHYNVSSKSTHLSFFVFCFTLYYISISFSIFTAKSCFCPIFQSFPPFLKADRQQGCRERVSFLGEKTSERQTNSSELGNKLGFSEVMVQPPRMNLISQHKDAFSLCSFAKTLKDFPFCFYLVKLLTERICVYVL